MPNHVQNRVKILPKSLTVRVGYTNVTQSQTTDTIAMPLAEHNDSYVRLKTRIIGVPCGEETMTMLSRFAARCYASAAYHIISYHIT